MPNSSTSLYHVILGLGLPLVLHFNVMEIPSLAITTGGKLRMDGFLGSTKREDKINYFTCYLILFNGGTEGSYIFLSNACYNMQF